MTNELVEALNSFGINPIKFEKMTELEQLKTIAKAWDKNGIDNKQQIIKLKQRIKYSKNPMEINQLQKEMGELTIKAHRF